MIPVELAVLLKATLILAIGLAVARLAHRAQASVRHLLLAATLGALVAFPLLSLAVPAVTIEVPVTQVSPQLGSLLSSSPDPVVNETNNRNSDAPASTLRSRISWATVARSAWIAGTIAVSVSLLLAVIRVRRIRRTAVPRLELRELVESLATDAGIRRPIDVLEHEALLAPLTCGSWRPAIILPDKAREWDHVDLERAIVHELEHVRRGDWLVQVGARVVCACYWFHPLVWVALRHMCLEAERACDDAVVRTTDRTDYADQLVLLARRLSATNAVTALGMANRSDLSVRVSALLDDRQRRGRAGVAAGAAAMLAATVLVVAIAPVRAVAKSSSTVTMTEDQREPEAPRRRVRAVDRALYEAAEAGDIKDVDQLLQAGANVNAAIGGDGSPLIGAARSRRPSMVRYLLDRGADVNMPVLGDGNPLIVAAQEGATNVVELLLDRGATIDQMVPGDESALIQASGEGHLDVVKLLVNRGANVNLGVWVEENNYGRQREWRSPLSMARKNRHSAVVEFLISAGAQD